jgi:hypothetical protein
LDSTRISFFVTPHLEGAKRNLPRAGYMAKTLKNLWDRQHAIMTMIMMMITTAAIIMSMTLSLFNLQQNVISLTFK